MNGAAILCLNGEPPSLEWIEPLWNAAPTRLAADGAINWLEPLGLVPDLVIGDLDSQDSARLPQVQRLRLEDQNDTDADKALSYLREKGLRQVLIFGGLGGRADMSLYNLFLFLRHPDLSLEFRQGSERIFLAPRRFTLKARPGSRLSLLPLGGLVSGLDLEGVKWRLKDATLDPTGVLSASNQVSQPEVRLRYRSGHLLVFLDESP
ncbi:MAG: thiamine diphosphokinase [bacterium]|nr:thiamine diphosphokinase [bacterium]